jgi:hypothetical protein
MALLHKNYKKQSKLDLRVASNLKRRRRDHNLLSRVCRDESISVCRMLSNGN